MGFTCATLAAGGFIMPFPKILWDTMFRRGFPREKNVFPVGTRVYKGFQGSGKTLGMVDYAFRIRKKFPDAKIFSNIKLRGIDYTYLANSQDILHALHYNNGQAGVLILLDEAHLFFNKKNGISLDVLSAISQQRKNRRRIVFSSQIWEELDLSLRKQVKEIVACSSFLNFFIQKISDGETLEYDRLQGTWIARPKQILVFKKAKFLGDRFDTYQEIVTNTEYVANAAPVSSFSGIIAARTQVAGDGSGARSPAGLIHARR